MKRAVLYLRVSTVDQTTANQERELRDVASRMGCEIIHVYKDHGISGAKGRDQRPAFDRLIRDANQRNVQLEQWTHGRQGRTTPNAGLPSRTNRSGTLSTTAPSSSRASAPTPGSGWARI